MTHSAIDVASITAITKDWGSLKSLFDGSQVGSRTGFNFGSIVYSKPHFSGTHKDHEIIYILEGQGSAKIGAAEINFREEYLLIIPAGTEHSISRVVEGPVKALLVHFS
jgi:mannose-6-phosphate isomerase-like protein (cupin superfamily)